MARREIKPSKTLIYFYYDCPKCGSQTEEYRAAEVKRGKDIECWECGFSFSIRPIESVQIKYSNKLAENSKTGEKGLHLNKIMVVKWVKDLFGLSLMETKRLVDSSIREREFTSEKDLFQYIVSNYK